MTTGHHEITRGNFTAKIVRVADVVDNSADGTLGNSWVEVELYTSKGECIGYVNFSDLTNHSRPRKKHRKKVLCFSKSMPKAGEDKIFPAILVFTVLLQNRFLAFFRSLF